MKTITINLEEKTALELSKLAQDVGLSLDELAKRILMSLPSAAKTDVKAWEKLKLSIENDSKTEATLQQDFEQVLQYVLTKNKELYKRLA